MGTQPRRKQSQIRRAFTGEIRLQSGSTHPIGRAIANAESRISPEIDTATIGQTARPGKAINSGAKGFCPVKPVNTPTGTGTKIITIGTPVFGLISFRPEQTVGLGSQDIAPAFEVSAGSCTIDSQQVNPSATG
ncbi:MAG: hypothetical protein ACYSSM_07705 [Planctomycetota bacterium]|jgi:hypothetical protein